MLINLLECASGDEDAVLELLCKFDPLIKKYGRILGTEDGYEDMRLAFLELVFKFQSDSIKNRSDGAIVNYIANSMKNSYIKLLKEKIKRQPTVSWDDLEASEFLQAAIVDELSLESLISCTSLTKKELKVLYLHFECGYHSAEIAKMMNVTRQNINQIKQKAIIKLKRAEKL